MRGMQVVPRRRRGSTRGLPRPELRFDRVDVGPAEARRLRRLPPAPRTVERAIHHAHAKAEEFDKVLGRRLGADELHPPSRSDGAASYEAGWMRAGCAAPLGPAARGAAGNEEQLERRSPPIDLPSARRDPRETVRLTLRGVRDPPILARTPGPGVQPHDDLDAG